MSNSTEKTSDDTSIPEGAETRDPRFTKRQTYEEALIAAYRQARGSTY